MVEKRLKIWYDKEGDYLGAIDFEKLEEFETFRVVRAQRPARTSMNRRRPASR